MLIVRARRRGDIERYFPDIEVEATPGRDYYFRAEISRMAVAEIIATNIQKIQYDNFKNSVSDDNLHAAYSKVWTTMSKLQVVPPYSANHRKQYP